MQDAGGDAEDFELYAEARRDGDLRRARLFGAVGCGRADRAGSRRARCDREAISRRSALQGRRDQDRARRRHRSAARPRCSRRTPTATEYGPARRRRSTPDDFNRMVRLLDARGWQVMTHAVGDRAVRMALTAYEHAVRSNPVPERGRRHRIEHVETVDSDRHPALRRARRHRVACSRVVGNPSPSQIDVWFTNVGPERASRGWPYGSISRDARDGSRLAATGRPCRSIRCSASTPPSRARRPTGPCLEGKAGIPPNAWRSRRRSTPTRRGAAWASFDEQRKGTPRAWHARGSRRAVRGHLRRAPVAPRLDARRRDDLRRQDRLSPRRPHSTTTDDVWWCWAEADSGLSANSSACGPSAARSRRARASGGGAPRALITDSAAAPGSVR